jgi:hypothetical protein
MSNFLGYHTYNSSTRSTALYKLKNTKEEEEEEKMAKKSTPKN